MELRVSCFFSRHGLHRLLSSEHTRQAARHTNAYNLLTDSLTQLQQGFLLVDPVLVFLQEAPLLKVEAPCLFVLAAGDPLCPPAELAGIVARMRAPVIHAVTVEVSCLPHPELGHLQWSLLVNGGCTKHW